jgi:hypothetical protein
LKELKTIKLNANKIMDDSDKKEGNNMPATC